jgi:hypothetical protein
VEDLRTETPLTSHIGLNSEQHMNLKSQKEKLRKILKLKYHTGSGGINSLASTVTNSRIGLYGGPSVLEESKSNAISSLVTSIRHDEAIFNKI